MTSERDIERPAPFFRALAFAVLLMAAGCNLVEEIEEDHLFAGTYRASAAPDSLVLQFTPAAGYDEPGDTPYLPLNAVDVLVLGGRLEMDLIGDGRAANQGSVQGRLVIADSVYLDADSTFFLVPDTTMLFEGSYVGVIDRVVFRPAEALQPTGTGSAEAAEPIAPIPQRWIFNPQTGTLRGTAQQPVVRELVVFDVRQGKEVKRKLQVGTLDLTARLRREKR